MNLCWGSSRSGLAAGRTAKYAAFSPPHSHQHRNLFQGRGRRIQAVGAVIETGASITKINDRSARLTHQRVAASDLEAARSSSRSVRRASL